MKAQPIKVKPLKWKPTLSKNFIEKMMRPFKTRPDEKTITAKELINQMSDKELIELLEKAGWKLNDHDWLERNNRI